MTLQQMRYLDAIAEAGSINKAAESLYVSQPSLTAAIQEVEREVGFAIFHRSGRGVTPTADGQELILYARQVLIQYETLSERFMQPGGRKKRFGVSTQHYSFAVKAFVNMVRAYDTATYDFAIRETRTQDVIRDVAGLISEVGILYLSDFNRPVISKLLTSNGLSFFPLARCKAYVYISRSHPLADRSAISMAELADYPCLSFEQGVGASFYFAEEILTTREYPRTIHTTDRATNLNLMIALNAYTLCSGVISEELNGPEYIAVPFQSDDENQNSVMEIGYITRKNALLTEPGQRFVDEIRKYLHMHAERRE